MTIDFSILKLLAKASPVLRYGSILVLIFYGIFGGLAGLICGLVVAALCWVIAFLCDAVIELYAEIEKLRDADVSSQIDS